MSLALHRPAVALPVAAAADDMGRGTVVLAGAALLGLVWWAARRETRRSAGWRPRHPQPTPFTSWRVTSTR